MWIHLTDLAQNFVLIFESDGPNNATHAYDVNFSEFYARFFSLSTSVFFRLPSNGQILYENSINWKISSAFFSNF